MAWNTTFEDACTYLVGPIMALVLRVRGELALHASGVQVGRAALALIGPHGAGKSTLAAALGRAGCPIGTDDLLRITHEGCQWVAHPYGNVVRLWPSAADLLYGDAACLPPITPSWDKRALVFGHGGRVGRAVAVPLRSLVFLNRNARAQTSCPLEKLSTADAVLRIVAKSTLYHQHDTAARAREFTFAARLAYDVRSIVLTVGDGTRALNDAVEQLLSYE
jgi:hypothetical protein